LRVSRACSGPLRPGLRPDSSSRPNSRAVRRQEARRGERDRSSWPDERDLVCLPHRGQPVLPRRRVSSAVTTTRSEGRSGADADRAEIVAPPTSAWRRRPPSFSVTGLALIDFSPSSPTSCRRSGRYPWCRPPGPLGRPTAFGGPPLPATNHAPVAKGRRRHPGETIESGARAWRHCTCYDNAVHGRLLLFQFATPWSSTHGRAAEGAGGHESLGASIPDVGSPAVGRSGGGGGGFARSVSRSTVGNRHTSPWRR